MNIKFNYLLLIISLFSGCTKYIHDFSNLVVEDGKYDTEFPHRNCSTELTNISRSTKMLTSVGYYTEYSFKLADRIQLADIDIGKAYKETNFNNNSTGTATVIYHQGNKVALLTCAHIVNAPDKIITFFDKPDETYIASVAFLDKKMIYCTGLQTDNIEILVKDNDIDIAVLGAETNEDFLNPIQYPTGQLKNLEWGSFTYLFGYPRGYKMISTGIVSLSKPQSTHFFFVDSPFNRGFSGGLVMAIKDGVPNFEIVGIATSAAAEFHQYLAPNLDDDAGSQKQSFEPYQGDLFIKRMEKIMYGVTQITSIDAVEKFWRKNSAYLESQGYYLDNFFEK